MTSMIYCNTVSKSPKDFISIHVHTWISVEILCLFIKVLNFSNHMRLLPVLCPTHKKEWSSPTVVTIILHKSSTRLWNKNTKEFISNTTIALSIDEYNLNSGNTIKTIIGGGSVNYKFFSLFSSIAKKKKRISTEITLKDIFSYRL